MRIRPTVLTGLCLFLVGGLLSCAEVPSPRLMVEIAYEGPELTQLSDIPAHADPQVGECLGGTAIRIARQQSERFGYDTDDRISPPFFIGLWPVADGPEDAVHGRTDVISVGEPRVGDNPFLKQIVCTNQEYDGTVDWRIAMPLDGRYHVAVWLDLNMNGFPGEGEPFGIVRDEEGEPLTVAFIDDEPIEVRVTMGEPTVGFGEQFAAMRAALEDAFIEEDEDRFLNQFHPLFYKDGQQRTFNELPALWAELTTDTTPARTEIEALEGSEESRWRGISIQQSKEPAIWDYAPNLERRVDLLLVDAQDDVYRIGDWKPLAVESGELAQHGTVTSSYDDGSIVNIPMRLAADRTVWFGVEEYVFSVTAPAEGTWELVPATNNPRTCSLNAGEHTFRITPGTSEGVACPITFAEINERAMMRATMIPMDAQGEGAYAPWTGYPDAATEPDRGNFARFYFYGSDYTYRSGGAR